MPVREFVEQTAAGKLRAVAEEMKRNGEMFDVIIASDTVIYFDGEIIGKPVDAVDAFNTLQRGAGVMCIPNVVRSWFRFRRYHSSRAQVPPGSVSRHGVCLQQAKIKHRLVHWIATVVHYMYRRNTHSNRLHDITKQYNVAYSANR
ncbi:unnamed protein product [Heligmosomoides polygyrus]|uniref:Uncharacterized protein n=1 Tax=Heligmosomoides polygyrus TaxID=6339 RepID=A0A3P8A623_HELPZ|nr:unnamed protein product [Heligmosomoides polygyrus]